MADLRGDIFGAKDLAAAVEVIVLRWIAWEKCKAALIDWHKFKGYKLTRGAVMKLRRAWNQEHPPGSLR